MTADFYERLAPYYDLLFEDWEASSARQAAQLDAVIQAAWGPPPRRILDAAAGIGTQALGLAARGYQVTASDLAPAALARAAAEAARRGVPLGTAVADLRFLDTGRTTSLWPATTPFLICSPTARFTKPFWPAIGAWSLGVVSSFRSGTIP